jgi:hypoxanthine phosphoribosyltransferase
MHQKLIERVVFSEEQIAQRVRELGAEISSDYGQGGNAELAIVSVLKGGFVFLADLIRTIDVDLTVDFMSISSYGETGSASSGVRIIKDLSESIYRRDVLVIEDIIDTGLTLSYILRNLKEREPRSLRVCTLLDRNEKRITPLDINYRGFEIGEEYVVGYGLDHMQGWRNLRFICTLRGVGPKEWHGGGIV